MGLTSMESIRDAAWVGTWALVWTPLRELHEPFRAVDITRESDREFQQLSIFAELQAAHASLMTRYETVPIFLVVSADAVRVRVKPYK